MKFLRANWLVLAVLVLVAVWLIAYGVSNRGESVSAFNDNTKALAQCLTDKGFKLYGAFWCGHCKEQKEMFGEAVGLLNYIECSTPDGNDQTEVCQEAGIEGYPTWGFPDGKKVSGVMTLEELAKVSGCPVK